jgi:hypothetical protein
LVSVFFFFIGVPILVFWYGFFWVFGVLFAPPPPPPEERYNVISQINFRDKTYGWKAFSFSIDSKTMRLVDPLNKNPFMIGFLKNLYLRPSCYQCPSKAFKSGSDITIGDYWGISNVLPEFDDDKGVSLVMINSIKGKSVYDTLRLDGKETNYSNALVGNEYIEKSVLLPKNRAVFFKRLNYKNTIPLIRKLTRASLWGQIRYLIVNILQRMGLLNTIKTIMKK